MARLCAVLVAGILALSSMGALAVPLPPGATGNLFIASFDIGGGTLFALEPGGTLRTIIQPFPQINALAFEGPRSLLVGSEGLDRVDRVVLNSDGSVQSRAVLLPGLPGAEALAFDAKGRLYVSDYQLDRIERVTFAPDGSVLTRSVLPHAFPHASGLAVNALGQLFVSEEDRQQVERLSFGPDGALLSVDVIAVGFPGASALAFDAAGNLYVAAGSFGGGLRAIDRLAFNPDGSVASRKKVADLPNGTALAFDAAGDLFAAEGFFGGGGNAVYRYRLDADGNMLSRETALAMDPFGPNALAFQPVAVPEPPSWVLSLPLLVGVKIYLHFRRPACRVSGRAGSA